LLEAVPGGGEGIVDGALFRRGDQRLVGFADFRELVMGRSELGLVLDQARRRVGQAEQAQLLDPYL
jgi:hypothetical protein